jgi:REP element-mobilizing transposase RayT
MKESQRRSIRLPDYDYSQAGAYFVTVCTNGRKCLFGDIADGGVRLSDAGKMVESVWIDIPKHYSGVNVDAFVAMPNHMHGIILLGVGAGPCACPDEKPKMGQPRGVAPTILLPDVVQRFKSLTTTKYMNGVRLDYWPPFRGRLWQRNYYEHVIRNENELTLIREYILNNPTKWAFDRENPGALERRRGPQKEIEEILGGLP